MSVSPIPETNQRPDWARLVARRSADHETRLKTLEAGGGGGGGGVSDGDKGDITVSAGGTVWTIDNGTVTLAKQANMATASVVYRKTAGAGAPEVQSLATLKTDLGLSGTNTGDQTSIVGITGTLAEFNAALTGADFATGGGTATGTNTGDQIVPVNTTATASQFFTAYNSATGAFTKAQPAFTDISGAIAATQMNHGIIMAHAAHAFAF